MSYYDTESKRLREWFLRLICEFRREYNKLLRTRKSISLLGCFDYRSPCQVEVFWMEYPEIQFYVVTHDMDRSDKEIIINGPYENDEFLDRVEEIIKEPRWQKEVFVNGIKRKLSKEFEYAIRSFVHDLVEYVFRPVSFYKNLPIPIEYTKFISMHWGNICNINPKEIVEYIFYEDLTFLGGTLVTIRPYEDKREKVSEKLSKQEIEENKDEDVRSREFSTYFYPPIWVSGFPKLSFKEKVLSLYVPWEDKVLEVKISDESDPLIVFYRDGYFKINVDKRSEAIKLSNIIMGTALLQDFDAFAVRESDIVSESAPSSVFDEVIKFTPYGVTYRLALSKVSFSLIDFEKRYEEIRKISIQDIINILDKALLIYFNACDEDIEYLLLLLESYTHLMHAEYAQSFTISWIILEKYINEIWQKFLATRNVSRKRRKKLTNPNYWNIDSILEVLNIFEVIKDNEYQLFMELKKKRNNFVHRGYTMEPVDARKAFEKAKKIVKEKVNNILEADTKTHEFVFKVF